MRLVFQMDKLTEPLLIIPEEHNIALKFRDDRLSTDHANLVRREKSDLKLPQSPILPENHWSMKLLQIVTREDKVMTKALDRDDKDESTNEHPWSLQEKICQKPPREV